MGRAPELICGYDVDDAGRAQATAADAPRPGAGSSYRWLHFDAGAEGLEPWLRAHLPDPAVDALLQAETRPRCANLADGAMINLRGVNLNPGANPEDMVSLRIWVTGVLVVTVRLRKIWAVDALRQKAEDGRAPGSAAGLVAAMAEGLTRRIEEVALELEDRTDALEEQVLGGEAVPLALLAETRHTVIKLRRFVNPQREALDALAAGAAEGVTAPDALLSLRETANRSARNVEALDALRERLMAMQDHLEAQRAHTMGTNAYLLSVVAAIFLPLGFLTGLFGVNVGGMPGVESDVAFWVLSVVSAGLGVVLYVVFKLSKWL